MTEPEGWQRTSVFAVVFFLVRLIRSMARNAVQASAPIAAFLLAYEAALMDKLVIAAVAVPIGMVTVSLLQYWFFRFRITDDAVFIRQGVLRKKQLDIKFARIQGITSQQNVFYRPLGLVDVSFDTAGSSSREGSLPAISAELGARLQSKIAVSGAGASTDAPEAASPRNEPLLRLGWRDMLRIGLADRRALIALAIIGPLYEQLGRAGQRAVEAYARGVADKLGDLGVATGVGVAVVIALIVVSVLALASIAAAFLRYHNFELHENEGRLQTVGGLLTRHTSSMDTRKVQRVQFGQGVVLRLFGRWRAVLRQASSAGASQSRSIVVPLVSPQLLPTLAALAFAPELSGAELDPRSARFRPISAYYLRPRILVVGVLPAVIAGLATPLAGGPYVWLLLLWPLLVAGYVYRSWRRYGIQVVDDGLVLRSGLIGYRLDLLLFRKVQRVTVHQSWWQRRRGLGGMTLYTASGSLRLRYVDYSMVCALRDRILCRVETSRQSWY